MANGMRFKELLVLSGLLLFIGAGISANTNGVKPRFTSGLEIGYSSGFHVQMSGMVSEFARYFPLSVRASIGYSTVEPGDAAAARRIFINNATNGVPEERAASGIYDSICCIPCRYFR